MPPTPKSSSSKVLALLAVTYLSFFRTHASRVVPCLLIWPYKFEEERSWWNQVFKEVCIRFINKFNVLFLIKSIQINKPPFWKMKSIIWNNRIIKLNNERNQERNKKGVLEYCCKNLKNNSQLLTIWAKSMENTNKEVDF